MLSKQNLRIRTLLMVLALVVGSNVGDLMLKSGMTEIGAVELSATGLIRALPLTVTNLKIWIGIIFQIGCTAGFMAVMSWADYSYVMPVGAFGYAMMTLLAMIFLHESVSRQRWIGVTLVCLGVLLVGRSKPRTTGIAGVIEVTR
jgi:uncharacterized membrane protein